MQSLKIAALLAVLLLVHVAYAEPVASNDVDEPQWDIPDNVEEMEMQDPSYYLQKCFAMCRRMGLTGKFSKLCKCRRGNNRGGRGR